MDFSVECLLSNFLFYFGSLSLITLLSLLPLWLLFIYSIYLQHLCARWCIIFPSCLAKSSSTPVFSYIPLRSHLSFSCTTFPGFFPGLFLCLLLADLFGSLPFTCMTGACFCTCFRYCCFLSQPPGLLSLKLNTRTETAQWVKVRLNVSVWELMNNLERIKARKLPPCFCRSTQWISKKIFKEESSKCM